MAQLIVRNIEAEVVLALKKRAAAKGVSAEAEHRDILRSVLLESSREWTFKDAIAAMPLSGDDEDFVVERDLERDDGLSD